MVQENDQENFMKAAVLDAAQSPFRVAQVARQTAQAGQVLVRIKASGVNPLDSKIRAAAAPHAQQPLPAILGIDLAGIVEATGPSVTELRPGDEVFGMTGGVGGLQGSLAEFAAVDARLLAHKPARISMREAAALPLAFITAWEGLVDRAAVRAGQKSSDPGRGRRRAHHYPTCARLRRRGVRGRLALGATPIDYRTMTVAQYTGGRGFNIVYDTIGGKTLDASFPAVRRFGHCGERARIGNACAGAAVVPRRDLFGCLHAASASDRRRPRASWRNSSGSGEAR